MHPSFTLEVQDKTITAIGMESNIDFYRVMALACREQPGLLAVATGIDKPFLNVVIDTRETAGSLTQAVAEFSAFFHEAGVPWAWLKTPLAPEQDMEAAGFSLLEAAPAYYLNLQQGLPDFNLPELEIREIKKCADLALWIAPLQEGFPSQDGGQAYLALNTRLMEKGEDKLRHFVGFYQNEPVVGGTLFCSSRSVMLHNIATKMAYRKRGFGTAFSLHLLREARKLGYQHCFLDSSEDGLALYRKLGFRLYCGLLFYTLDKT